MFDLDKCIACVINRAGIILANNFEKMLKRNNITRTSWYALYYIGTYPELNQKGLAEMMGFNTSSIVAIVRKLEKEELISCEITQIDNRYKKLGLTQKGKELYHKLLKVSDEYKQICVEGIDKEDIDQLEKTLEKMVSNSKKV